MWWITLVSRAGYPHWRRAFGPPNGIMKFLLFRMHWRGLAGPYILKTLERIIKYCPDGTVCTNNQVYPSLRDFFHSS